MSAATTQTIRFVLNGSPVRAEVDAERTLLELLREDFGILSPKSGCAPQAACGCCSVLIDGAARMSCAMKATRADGHEITTLEGFTPELREQLADTFVSAGAVQCGFCTPGIAVQAVSLLDRKPDPSRGEIAYALRHNLCRCTGYQRVLDAVEQLARLRRGDAPEAPMPDTSGKVGTSLPRFHGRDLVLGEHHFVDDLRVDGMLYAAFRFADHPRALVKSIDAAAVAGLAGVERVLTAADVPGERFVGLLTRDWPILVAEGEETRCVGDVIAIVVADSARNARAVAGRIPIEYEVRTPVTSPEEGLAEGAPAIHPDGNLLSRSVIRRDDAETAFRSSAHVVSGRYETQRIEHLFLEPEACLAVPEVGEDGQVARLEVFSQSQGVFDDRRQIAEILGWSEDRVGVQLVHNGGGFGGKEDLSVQGQTALAAVSVRQAGQVHVDAARRASACTPSVTPIKMRDQGRLRRRRPPARRYVCGSSATPGAYASVGAKVHRTSRGPRAPARIKRARTWT